MTGTDLLPGSASALEVSERLRQFEWLNDNSLLLLVVSNLSVSGKREVLSERVSIKSVIGHNSPQVRVASEEDSKEVVNFTLIPVRTVVERSDGWHGGGLVGEGLDTNARVVADREHVVDDLEALVAGRVIDCGDVADLGEFGSGVVLQEIEDGEDSLWGDVDDQLVLPDGEPKGRKLDRSTSSLFFLIGLCILLDPFGQSREQVLSVLVHGLRLVLELVGGVDDRDVESSLGTSLCVLERVNICVPMGDFRGVQSIPSCWGSRRYQTWAIRRTV